MFLSNVIFCLVIIYGKTSAELELQKDVNEIVTFDGPELEIKVDYSRGVEGDFTLCIKSVDQAFRGCPTGYGRIHVSFGNGIIKTFKVNRNGEVNMGKEFMATMSIVFNKDAALELILKEIPDKCTVKLLNAERYVPPEPTETTTPKKSNSMATFSVVVIVLLVISGVLIVGAVIFTCYCRKRTPLKTEESNDPDENHETPKSLKAHKYSVRLPAKLSQRTSSITVTTTVLPTKSSATKQVRTFPT